MFCPNCGAQISPGVKFCPNCGTQVAGVVPPSSANRVVLPEGPELLNGLYTVQAFLEQINARLTHFWELERYYRQLQHTQLQHTQLRMTVQKDTAAGKFQYGLFVAGIAFCLVFGLIGLFAGNTGNFFFLLIILVIFVIGKVARIKPLLIVGGILLALSIVVWIIGLVTVSSSTNSLSTVIYIAVNIMGLIVASIVAAITLKIYNKRVNRFNRDAQNADAKYNANAQAADAAYNEAVQRNNRELDQQRRSLSAEITALVEEMQQKTAAWYPVDYYVLDSVEKFIVAVKNHEADTVKEMVSIYKQDTYRAQVVDNLTDMNMKLNQVLYNQQEMLRLQRISNLIQMANLAANLTTAANTSAIRKDTAAIMSFPASSGHVICLTRLA